MVDAESCACLRACGSAWKYGRGSNEGEVLVGVHDVDDFALVMGLGLVFFADLPASREGFLLGLAGVGGTSSSSIGTCNVLEGHANMPRNPRFDGT